MKTRFRSKSLLLIFLAYLVVQPAFSQDLDNLDSKFGVNKFKLESDISLYKGNLAFDLKGDDKVAYYMYKGNDFKSLFGVALSYCALGFYENKLYSISIQFGLLPKRDEDLLHYKLKELFGVPNFGIGKTPINYLWHYKWETTKTYLGFEKLSEDSDYKPGHVSIFMLSSKMNSQINNDNF